MPTTEEFSALQQALAEATRRSESLIGELRVMTTERDLALERLHPRDRQSAIRRYRPCGRGPQNF